MGIQLVIVKIKWNLLSNFVKINIACYISKLACIANYKTGIYHVFRGSLWWNKPAAVTCCLQKMVVKIELCKRLLRTRTRW